MLGRVRYKPHISLFHVAVKKVQVPEMIRRLKSIASSVILSTITVLPIEPYDGGAGYSMQVSKTKTLQRLHESVLRAINPLRDRKFPNTWKYPELQQPRYKKNVQRYGSPVVAGFFAPHVTISYGPQKSRLRFDKRRFRFTPRELVVCRLGPFHSCHGVITRVPLFSDR